MNLTNYYYFWKKSLPTQWCKDVIKKGVKSESKLGTIFGSKKDITDPKRRHSTISWLNEKWIYEAIHPFIHSANEKAGWNFHWNWTQEAQFTIYEEGQYYDWHSDDYQDVLKKPLDKNENGKQRKLSLTVSLSDPEDYEGGDLEFFLPTHPSYPKNITCKEIRPQGSIVVFPSFVWHRVTPVTRGVRYSLVAWNLGNPWK